MATKKVFGVIEQEPTSGHFVKTGKKELAPTQNYLLYRQFKKQEYIDWLKQKYAIDVNINSLEPIDYFNN